MAKLISSKLPKHIWTEESGLTSMLILLCISNFVIFPFFTERQTLLLIVRLIWFILLIAGIATLSRSKSQLWALLLIPILFILVSMLQYFISNKILTYIDFIAELAVFSLLTGLVIARTFERGPVTIHRVVGAIVIYMIIGNIWASIYSFIYEQIPGSLQIPASLAGSGDVPPSVFLYFSYTTLTTTGYGDILPVHALARTMVIIQHLIGVLYPAVLIGRLVSLVVVNSENSTNEQK